jgi:hypothetical protein
MERMTPPEDGQHEVASGEWVGSIAMSYGITDWKNAIWNHSNNADLKEKRQDPCLLVEGDILFIPQRKTKQESGSTEQQHKFKLKVPTEVVRVRILDLERKVLANEDYKIELDYEPGGGVFVQKNTSTNAEGVLEEKIPSTATGGRILLTRIGQEIALSLGCLVPTEKKKTEPDVAIRGVQQRLYALGLYTGPIDGEENEELEGCVAVFQQFCQENLGKDDDTITDAGEPTGEINEKMRSALVKYFGC